MATLKYLMASEAEQVFKSMNIDFGYNLDLRRDPKDTRDFIFTANPLTEAVEFPTSVDYTDEMTSVKNQGRKGSCVGFAVCALKEWQEHKEKLKESKKTKAANVEDLSEQWLYHKSKLIDPWPGEEGTSIRYAMKVLNKIGAPCEKGWKYSDITEGDPENWATLIARWSLIDSYERIYTLYGLRKALLEAPVPIGVAVFREFFSPVNGVVAYPANAQEMFGGHAVCAVGYDDEKQLIKFKNSWSAGWGENGYGYLPYNYINSFLWDAWSAKDMSVTREQLKGKRSLF